MTITEYIYLLSRETPYPYTEIFARLELAAFTRSF